MHGCKNCILHVRKYNSRKIWCWGKSLLFLSLLVFNQNFLGVFAEKFQHGGQTCVSHLQMILPRKKNKSLEKHLIFFENLGVKITEFCVEASCTVVKTAFYMYGGQFEKNLMLGKKVYCFVTFEFYSKYVRSFCRKISARWSKLHFTSRDDHFKKEQISRIKQNFWIFLRIWASNLGSLVKTSYTVVKTAFYM